MLGVEVKGTTVLEGRTVGSDIRIENLNESGRIGHQSGRVRDGDDHVRVGGGTGESRNIVLVEPEIL